MFLWNLGYFGKVFINVQQRKDNFLENSLVNKFLVVGS